MFFSVYKWFCVSRCLNCTVLITNLLFNRGLASIHMMLAYSLRSIAYQVIVHKLHAWGIFLRTWEHFIIKVVLEGLLSLQKLPPSCREKRKYIYQNLHLMEERRKCISQDLHLKMKRGFCSIMTYVEMYTQMHCFLRERCTGAWIYRCEFRHEDDQ